jgi:hypothetical protein
MATFFGTPPAALGARIIAGTGPPLAHRTRNPQHEDILLRIACTTMDRVLPSLALLAMLREPPTNAEWESVARIIAIPLFLLTAWLGFEGLHDAGSATHGSR